VGDPLPAAAVGHESVMADLMKPAWQNVPQESIHKIRSGQRHLLPAYPVFSVVLVAEPDLVLIDADQPVIADGHPVSISADVAHNLVGIFKRGLAVYHPFAGGQLIQPELKATAVGQFVIRQGQFVLIIGLFEALDKLAAKDLRQCLDREQKFIFAGCAYPATVFGQGAAGHDEMNMGMRPQGLAPGVQHAVKPDLTAKPVRIAAECQQGSG